MMYRRHKTRDRRIIFHVLLCFTVGCIIFIAVHIYKPSKSSIYLSVNSYNETIDRQDEWKYQNSITGQWHYWTTTYKKQPNDTKWTVKWLNTPPTSSLGVIVYLTTRDELSSLNQSFVQLSRLLVNKPRPVVVFHEGDFGDDDIQQYLAKILGSRTPLGFEQIQFINKQNPSKIFKLGGPITYLNMCRFFILMLPNHPLLTLFSFYWRMDAHSYIFGPNPIQDPFEIMENRQIQYAYIMANEEGDGYAIGLWELFRRFLNHHNLKPSIAVRQTQTTFTGGYSLQIIFTNFAIANVSLFRDHSLIRAWLHTIDDDGGIYRHRWGDAPVHTLAVTQFLQRNQIVRFRYFGYWHRREYACASGTENNQCKEQVKPFLIDPKIEYLNYDDGCWPSSRNLLCHYYPEIKL